MFNMKFDCRFISIFEHLGTSTEHLLASMRMMERLNSISLSSFIYYDWKSNCFLHDAVIR